MSRIPLAKPVINSEMEEAAIQALRNERLVLGESVFKFEEEFARFCGVRQAVAVSNGTIALQLALQALDVTGRDAQVLTTPMTFIATANAVLHAQAVPTFADVLPTTALLNPDGLMSRMDGVKAVIPVHLYGCPAPLRQIRDVVGEEVVILEDACQAHGALVDGKRVGSVGSAGAFSFYSIKNMTVGGDGGMVTTDSEEVAAGVRLLRDCGRKSQYEHTAIGYTARLNTINAAIGRVQLRSLDRWNARRRHLAARYSDKLSDIERLGLPSDPSYGESVFHLYVVTSERRDALQEYLTSHGIETGVHYPIPVHLQDPYRQRYGYRPGMFPVAEAHAMRALSLPLFPEMTDEQVDLIAERVHSFLGRRPA